MSDKPWEAAMLGDPQRIELMRARIEADEALMRTMISAWESGSVTDLGISITALRKRLETSNAS